MCRCLWGDLLHIFFDFWRQKIQGFLIIPDTVLTSISHCRCHYFWQRLLSVSSPLVCLQEDVQCSGAGNGTQCCVCDYTSTQRAAVTAPLDWNFIGYCLPGCLADKALPALLFRTERVVSDFCILLPQITALIGAFSASASEVLKGMLRHFHIDCRFIPCLVVLTNPPESLGFLILVCYQLNWRNRGFSVYVIPKVVKTFSRSDLPHKSFPHNLSNKNSVTGGCVFGGCLCIPHYHTNRYTGVWSCHNLKVQFATSLHCKWDTSLYFLRR